MWEHRSVCNVLYFRKSRPSFLSSFYFFWFLVAMASNLITNYIKLLLWQLIGSLVRRCCPPFLTMPECPAARYWTPAWFPAEGLQSAEAAVTKKRIKLEMLFNSKLSHVPSRCWNRKALSFCLIKPFEPALRTLVYCRPLRPDRSSSIGCRTGSTLELGRTSRLPNTAAIQPIEASSSFYIPHPPLKTKRKWKRGWPWRQEI